MPRPLCSLLLLLLAPALATAALPPERARAVARLYEQAEAQLERAVLFVKKEALPEGVSQTRQVWLRETGECLKVSSEQVGPRGRHLIEIFGSDWPYFALERIETPAADGGTDVEEKRIGFEEHTAGMRLLTKSAHFKAGESLDTVVVKNQERDPASLPAEEKDAQAWYRQMEAIIDAVAKGARPVCDARLSPPGDSARYRLIMGTASPDARYALGLGLPDPQGDWDAAADPEGGQILPTFTMDGADHLKNYVVDLATHKILGVTGCEHFGTRQSYNHRACQVEWAPHAGAFAQLTSEKWTYAACRAGVIGNGRLLGTVDLGKAAEQSAFDFLAAKKNAAWRKHHRDIGIALHLDSVADDGTIQLQVWGEIPKSELAADNFSLIVRLRLRNTLKVEPLQVRYAPE